MAGASSSAACAPHMCRQQRGRRRGSCRVVAAPQGGVHERLHVGAMFQGDLRAGGGVQPTKRSSDQAGEAERSSHAMRGRRGPRTGQPGAGSQAAGGPPTSPSLPCTSLSAMARSECQPARACTAAEADRVVCRREQGRGLSEAAPLPHQLRGLHCSEEMVAVEWLLLNGCCARVPRPALAQASPHPSPAHPTTHSLAHPHSQPQPHLCLVTGTAITAPPIPLLACSAALMPITAGRLTPRGRRDAITPHPRGIDPPRAAPLLALRLSCLRAFSLPAPLAGAGPGGCPLAAAPLAAGRPPGAALLPLLLLLLTLQSGRRCCQLLLQLLHLHLHPSLGLGLPGPLALHGEQAALCVCVGGPLEEGGLFSCGGRVIPVCLSVCLETRVSVCVFRNHHHQNTTRRVKWCVCGAAGGSDRGTLSGVRSPAPPCPHPQLLQVGVRQLQGSCRRLHHGVRQAAAGEIELCRGGRMGWVAEEGNRVSPGAGGGGGRTRQGRDQCTPANNATSRPRAGRRRARGRAKGVRAGWHLHGRRGRTGLLHPWRGQPPPPWQRTPGAFPPAPRRGGGGVRSTLVNPSHCVSAATPIQACAHAWPPGWPLGWRHAGAGAGPLMHGCTTEQSWLAPLPPGRLTVRPLSVKKKRAYHLSRSGLWDTPL